VPKLPYLPLYTGDWLKDPALTLCAPATRGVWIDLLAAMHELNRSGELRGTAEQLARAARCSTVEFAQAATDLQNTGAADVTFRNGTYHVQNRRMRKESARRSSKSESEKGLTDKKKTDNSEYEIESAFELFWNSFPKGRKKSKGTAREAFAKAAKKVSVEKIVAAAAEYARSESGRGPYVKMPSTWLNQECWNDDREAWKDISTAAPAKPKEYRTIEPHIFKQFRDTDEFQTRPLQDPSVPGRWFGQLRNGRKVETFVTPKSPPREG
jgi:hypothetical protein